MEYHSRLLMCLQRNGVELPGEKEPAVEVFEWLRERALFGKAGRRTTMTRFAGAVYSCTKLVPWWAVDEFERTYIALEMDFLGNKGISKLIISGEARASLDADEGGASTGASRPTIHDAVLRSVACNAVAISQIILADRSNERFCEMLLLTAEILVEWHTVQNTEQRSAAGSLSWMRGQVQGGYMEHCRSFLRVVATGDKLRQCGFAMDSSQIDNLENDIVSEDEFAGLLGQSCLALLTFRLRRNLHMLSGWPRRFLRCSGGAFAKEQESCISLFKQDHEAWEHLSRQEGKTNLMKLALRRSCFEKTSVDQMWQCLQRTGFLWGPRLTQVVDSHVEGLVQTQIVEDIFGHQKNDKSTRARQRFRRPVSSMCVALASDVITERHQFKTVSADFALPTKRPALDTNHFYPTRAKQSLDFHSIATTSQVPPYFSPKAEKNNIVVSDLFLLREYIKRNTAQVFSGAEFNIVLHFSHRILLHEKDSLDPTWWLGLLSFPQSAALVWPCRRRVVPGHPTSFWFEPDLECYDPVAKTITEITEWEACGYAWRSWAWQKLQFGGSLADCSPALRMFQSEGPTSIFQYAASQAFWNLSAAQVAVLSRAAGFEANESKPAFETLAAAVQNGLGFIFMYPVGDARDD